MTWLCCGPRKPETYDRLGRTDISFYIKNGEKKDQFGLQTFFSEDVRIGGKFRSLRSEEVTAERTLILCSTLFAQIVNDFLPKIKNSFYGIHPELHQIEYITIYSVGKKTYGGGGVQCISVHLKNRITIGEKKYSTKELTITPKTPFTTAYGTNEYYLDFSAIDQSIELLALSYFQDYLEANPRSNCAIL